MEDAVPHAHSLEPIIECAWDHMPPCIPPVAPACTTDVSILCRRCAASAAAAAAGGNAAAAAAAAASATASVATTAAIAAAASTGAVGWTLQAPKIDLA